MRYPGPWRALAVLATVALAVGAGATPAVADEIRDRSWHLAALKVADAHRVTRGDGIVVAVVDTGVDADHPDLRGSVQPGVDMTDPANASRGLRDSNGHGTAVASLIAGHGHGAGNRDGVLGIAPGARLVPYNIYDERVRGAAPGAIARAIRLAVERGADVVCVAFGGAFEREDRAAVEFAVSRDVLVVASAGNPPAVLVQEPAGIRDTVAVTGVDRAGKLSTTVRGVPDREIDIAAPGADITTALPGGRYGTSTGTSAATAIVAGAVALIRARHPRADRNEQLQRLVWTTTEAGPAGRDFEYGWGMLNLVAALTTEPSPPPGVSARVTTGPASPPAQAGDVGPDAGEGSTLPLVLGLGAVLVLALLVLGLVAILVRSRRRAT